METETEMETETKGDRFRKKHSDRYIEETDDRFCLCLTLPG